MYLEYFFFSFTYEVDRELINLLLPDVYLIRHTTNMYMYKYMYALKM